jgi:PilZ domain-containing protein
MTERRTARRFEIAVPIMGWGSGAKCFNGQTCDLSTNGVYLVANGEVKPSESFVFLMQFPGLFSGEGNGLLWAYCRAVRVEPRNVDGVACVGIAAAVERYTLPPRTHVALPAARWRVNWNRFTLSAVALDSARD